MFRRWLVCIITFCSAQTLAGELDPELGYPIDQPLVAIHDAQAKNEMGESFRIAAGSIVHIDWDDGEQLITKVGEQQLFISRADLRPIQQAVVSYTRQLLLTPSKPELFILRSHAYDLLGRQADALADAQSAAELAPQVSAPVLLRGMSAANSGDLLAAWHEADLVRMFDPFNSQGYLLSAFIAMKLGDQETAGSNLWTALELQPQDSETLRCLANFLGANAKTPEQWEFVLSVLGESVRGERGNYQPLALRGKVHRELGHSAEAKADFAACIRLQSSWLKGCPDNPRFWIDRGCVFVELENWEAALYDFAEATRVDPRLEAPYQHRYAIWAKRNNYPKALEELERIVELQPRSSQYRLLRIKLLFLQRNYRQVISEATDLLEYDPRNGGARWVRASAWAAVQDWAAAESDCRTLLADKSAARLPNPDLATLCLVLGQEIQTRSLLEGQPTSVQMIASCYHKLARRALYRGDIEAAQSALATIAETHSKDREFRLLRGICSHLAGDSEAASEDLRWVVSTGTTTPRVNPSNSTNLAEQGDQKKPLPSFAVESIKIDDEGFESVKTVDDVFSSESTTATKKPQAASENSGSSSQAPQLDELALNARFMQILFKILHHDETPVAEELIKNGVAKSKNLSSLYVMVRIAGLDPSQRARKGSNAIKYGEALVNVPITPAYFRIPLYEAIAAGHADGGNFPEAIRWQRRILDETSRDHPSRAWYAEVHNLYLRGEKYPLGRPDPDLFPPVLRLHLDLEDAPGLLSPLPPALPE